MLEKELDIHIASILKRQKIDFFRVKNSNFRGGLRNFNTEAFSEPFSVDKYFPDFMFPYAGRVYLIENGIKVGGTINNQRRKRWQATRGKYWEEHGGCYYQVITSIEEANLFFSEMLKTAVKRTKAGK